MGQSLIEQAVAIRVDREDLDRLAHTKTQRRGQTVRTPSERLRAAAARGRIIDAEAERRCADQAP